MHTFLEVCLIIVFSCSTVLVTTLTVAAVRFIVLAMKD